MLFGRFENLSEEASMNFSAASRKKRMPKVAAQMPASSLDLIALRRRGDRVEILRVLLLEAVERWNLNAIRYVCVFC